MAMIYPEKSLVYFDAERTIDTSFLRRFPFMDPEEDVVFVRESIIENIWERIEIYIREKAVDVVVIDSVGALMSQSEMDKDISENVVGDPARKYSWGFKKLYDFMDSGITFIFINQFRENIGQMFGPTKKAMGERTDRSCKTWLTRKCEVLGLTA